MFVVIYNEGQGFTEYKREYASLTEAIEKEGDKISESHIYKNEKRIF